MLKIKIANNDEIKESREVWSNLVKSMKEPSVFLTWEWITTWLDHYGKHYKPLVLFIQDESRIVSIIPLAQRYTRLKNGFLKARVISFCGSMEIYPDQLDIICENDKADIYIKMVLDYFTNNYTSWDIIHLALLSGEGNLSKWLQSNYKRSDLHLLNKSRAPFIKLENSIDIILNGFNSKKKYNLKREMKILCEKKGATFKAIKTQSEMERGIEDLFRLHTERTKEKRIRSTFDEESILNFHRDIAKIFLDLGWLSLYLLICNNNVISASYGFIFEKKYYYYQTGLSPEWQQFSPGKMLIFKILENIHDENINEFDFLSGDEVYKTYWTKYSRLLLTLNLYNNNITGIVEKWANRSMHVIKSLVKKTPVFEILKRSLQKK